MRTTLTLDDDVVAMLKRARAGSQTRFKQLINDLLRSGLQQRLEPKRRRKPFKTAVYDGGACLIDSLDNVEEVLAQVEGEMRK
jgi:hypothetical protein